MKQKFLLSLVFVCTFIATTHAQIKKGAIWLGGNIGYAQSKNDYEMAPDFKNTTISINPAIGVVVKDNLVVGLALGYFKNKTDNNGGIMEFEEKSYGAGFFARQYLPVISKLNIFAEASIIARSYKSNELRYYNNQERLNTKGWDGNLNITPGISYGIGKNLQLEAGFNSLFQIAYQKRKTTSNVNGGDLEKNQFAAGLNLDNESLFSVGFRFLINKKA